MRATIFEMIKGSRAIEGGAGIRNSMKLSLSKTFPNGGYNQKKMEDTAERGSI